MEVIERGRILAYRVFDAGDTITLDVAQEKLKGRLVETGGPLFEGIVLLAHPVEVDLDPCVITIEGFPPMTPKITAHLFDFGAISFVFDIPIDPGTSLVDLTPFCDALYDAPALEACGRRLRQELLDRLGKAVEKPHQWAEAETYTVIFAEQMGGCQLQDLSTSENVAKLLLGETSTKRLHRNVREDVLKNSFSYLEDDIAVVDWNSEFVVEPTGSRIVPFVLELATSQLLEFRFYDGLLDRELGRVYDEVERARPSSLRSPYGDLTRGVLRRFMELTEFTERVDNAIKSVGDFYLTRLYLAAIRRFRIPEWRESVESKLGLVAKAYELLKGDVEVWRTTSLEIVVVVLILIELITALRH